MQPYSKLSDGELVSLLETGEEIAFTEIYGRYWKLLYEKSYNILRDADAAQDAVQEVFISLWNGKEKTKILCLKAYLHQATRFRVFKAIRMNNVSDEFYHRLSRVTSEILVENPTLFNEQEELIQSIIQSLPSDCKEVFRLSREEELTYKEIAQELNVSIKTVEKRVSKSLKHIRQNLNLRWCITVLVIIKCFKE